MNSNSKVICMVGPSGVGKTSFAMRLAKQYGFKLSPVVTTRMKRSDDDKRYRYVSDVDFHQLIVSGYFLEWDKYTDYYYGTPNDSVNGFVSGNRASAGIILDLTPNGCLKVKEVIPKAVTIALLPNNPNWLEKRLISRNSQPYSEIKARIKLLHGYLEEVRQIPCEKIFVDFSPDSWDGTFKAITRIVL